MQACPHLLGALYSLTSPLKLFVLWQNIHKKIYQFPPFVSLQFSGIKCVHIMSPPSFSRAFILPNRNPVSIQH